MKDLSSSNYMAPAGVEHIVGVSAKQKLSFYQRYGKRCVDILLALALLPIIAPVVGVLALLVRRDGGSGMYTQPRVGKNGREFPCFKLRTMHVDAEAILEKLCAEDADVAAEWNKYQKLKNDPRITRVGAFLRKTSLDELPQLWNVLRGDMSFVGPRPFLPCQQDMYIQAGGHAYFKTRPGITGLWQIEGRGTTTFLDRIKFDNAYDDRMSLGLDLRLIAQTAGVVVKPTGE